jgi:hypothetical protein
MIGDTVLFRKRHHEKFLGSCRTLSEVVRYWWALWKG